MELYHSGGERRKCIRADWILPKRRKGFVVKSRERKREQEPTTNYQKVVGLNPPTHSQKEMGILLA